MEIQELKLNKVSLEEAITLKAEASMIEEEIWQDALETNSTKIDKDVANSFILKAQEAILAFQNYKAYSAKDDEQRSDADKDIESLREDIVRMEKAVEGIIE